MAKWLPPSISTFSGDIDGLLSLIVGIVGVWFVATQLLILWSLIAYRRRPGHRAEYIRGERWSQLAWVMVPVAIVLALDLFIDEQGAPVWAHVKEHRPKADLHLRATAKQFNWDFKYAGPDGKFDTADDLESANELHVPANQNIVIDLSSKDVLHSFFIPVARLKQDVVPGRTIQAWFNATQPGRYEIPCAELCGFGHYTMRGFLVVHDPADWKKWVAEQWPTPAAQEANQ